MLGKLVENVRGKSEELEQLERAVMTLVSEKGANRKVTCANNHKISILLDEIQLRSADLVSYYQNRLGEIEEEVGRVQEPATYAGVDALFDQDVAALLGNEGNGRLLELPEVPQSEQKWIDEATDRFQTAGIFRPEEHQGRCMDWQEFFQAYKNIKGIGGVEFVDYLSFVRDFERVLQVPWATKVKEAAKVTKFYAKMIDYLQDFYRRWQPLVNFGQFKEQLDRQFEELERQQTPEESQMPQGIYCEVCQRLFATESVFKHHFEGKQHKNRALAAQQNGGGPSGDSQEKYEAQFRRAQEEKLRPEKTIQRQEFMLQSYLELLDEVRQATTNEIRRLTTYNAGELIDEVQEHSGDDLSISDREEEERRPRRNLPMDATGKPIPMWIFKMQGLGVEFKCEICGNYSYWGRRAFEKHFSEWRHSYGMKCLRIPNTAHFFEITSINDALILHKKLVMESQRHKFDPKMEEEVEDGDGRVVPRALVADTHGNSSGLR